MVSPICLLNSTSTTDGVNVTPSSGGNTIRLADTSGVNVWEITCIYTDELSNAAAVTAALSVDMVTKIATFSAPVAGRAYIMQSKVNNGLNTNGVADSSLTTTFGIYTLIYTNRVAALNETIEGSHLYGWITKINPLLRNSMSAPVSMPHLTGTRNNPESALKALILLLSTYGLLVDDTTVS